MAKRQEASVKSKVINNNKKNRQEIRKCSVARRARILGKKNTVAH